MSLLDRLLGRGPYVDARIIHVSEDGDTAEVEWPRHAPAVSAGTHMRVEGERVVVAAVNRDGSVVTIHRVVDQP